MDFPIRINTYLAHTGVASRREADTMIKKGTVLINGKKATLGQLVSASDAVTLATARANKTYLAYYKGRGIIAHSPAAGETDIVTRLKQDYGLTDLAPVGRLDKASEGLLLVTNDGRVTGPLLDPEANHEKEYEVLLDKPVKNTFVRAMMSGVSIEGYRTKPAKVSLVAGKEKMIRIILTEGKKHQIRRMCAALGYQVQALKRVRIMHITLGALKPNQYRKLTVSERDTLLTKLGIAL